MANLHRVRDALVAAYISDVLDEEEFIMLYSMNSPSNPDFQYKSDEYQFNLDKFNDDECNSYFRFQKNDIYRLKHALGVPPTVILENKSKIDGLEALCITLQRYAYPCRYGDLIKDYGRSVPQLYLAFKWMTNYIFDIHRHRISSLDQPWLSPQHLQEFAEATHTKGAALRNCWGFVDGTVRPICRPNQHQQVMYNGHKRIHAMKFQSVTAPNGLIAHLYGPVEGRRHDAFLLRESGLLTELEARSHDPQGNVLCVYGDPAYPLRPQLQAPFPTVRITPEQVAFNAAMSKVRISVEWLFVDIVNIFKFTDYKKSQKVQLSACGKMYIVSGILTNAHTCVYKNNTSAYFELEPPSLEEYFQ
ncbi:uncharacterized protein [Antedon mediterranea]|uniref:uncharacterized protein isoform X1 n=1 Tax=Antedon mediterranea TaxID=105859 RepID=UPI003AF92E40